MPYHGIVAVCDLRRPTLNHDKSATTKLCHAVRSISTLRRR